MNEIYRSRMNQLAHLLVEDKASVKDWLEFSQLYVDFKTEEQEYVDSNINKIIANNSGEGY
jgi:hypothetical protein